jgi:hypothetical protein
MRMAAQLNELERLLLRQYRRQTLGLGCLDLITGNPY